MIQEVLFPRNNKNYKVLTGIDEVTGEAPNIVLPDHPHQTSKQTFDLVLENISIGCATGLGERGTPTSMIATWVERHYDNAGRLIASYQHKEPHVLTPEEVKEFTVGFLPMLQPSIYNGVVRGGQNADSILLGQNHEPLFNPDGTVNTLAKTDAAPTYDYNPPVTSGPPA